MIPSRCLQRLSIAIGLSISAAWAEPTSTTSVRVTEGPQGGVEVLGGDKVLLRSPAEGLWSVATAWKDGWPADWQHARPTKVEKEGDWTIVHGFLNLPKGQLGLRDTYRQEGDLVEDAARRCD